MLAWSGGANISRTRSASRCVIRNCPDYYYGVCNHSVAEGPIAGGPAIRARTLGDGNPGLVCRPSCPTHDHDDMFATRAAKHGQVDLWPHGRASHKGRAAVSARDSWPISSRACSTADPMHTGINAQELIRRRLAMLACAPVKNGKDVFVKANRGCSLSRSAVMNITTSTKDSRSN